MLQVVLIVKVTWLIKLLFPKEKHNSTRINLLFHSAFHHIPLPVKGIFTVRNVVAARLCFHRHLSFCSQEGMYPSMHWADTSQADTPLGRQPPPSWADTPTPWVDIPWQTPTPPGPWQTHTPRADTPPPPAATAADSTHPTGMHSCC